jgi:hypothetical protein
MSTEFKLTVGCILAVLVVLISSGSYSMIQVNTQMVQGQIKGLPLAQQIDICKNLSDRMLNGSDPMVGTAAEQFGMYDCMAVLEKESAAAPLDDQGAAAPPVDEGGVGDGGNDGGGGDGDGN